MSLTKIIKIIEDINPPKFAEILIIVKFLSLITSFKDDSKIIRLIHTLIISLLSKFNARKEPKRYKNTPEKIVQIKLNIHTKIERNNIFFLWRLYLSQTKPNAGAKSKTENEIRIGGRISIPFIF